MGQFVSLQSNFVPLLTVSRHNMMRSPATFTPFALALLLLLLHRSALGRHSRTKVARWMKAAWGA